MRRKREDLGLEPKQQINCRLEKSVVVFLKGHFKTWREALLYASKIKGYELPISNTEISGSEVKVLKNHIPRKVDEPL